MREQVRQVTNKGSAPQAIAFLCGTIAFVAVAVAAIIGREEPAVALVKAGGAAMAVGAVALVAGCLGMAVLGEKRAMPAQALVTDAGSSPVAPGLPGTARGGGRPGAPPGQPPGQPPGASLGQPGAGPARSGEGARVRTAGAA